MSPTRSTKYGRAWLLHCLASMASSESLTWKHTLRSWLILEQRPADRIIFIIITVSFIVVIIVSVVFVIVNHGFDPRCCGLHRLATLQYEVCCTSTVYPSLS